MEQEQRQEELDLLFQTNDDSVTIDTYSILYYTCFQISRMCLT